MIAKDIHKILEKRVRLDSHDSFGTEECWKAEIQLLTDNINNTLYFFEYECSDEDFFWLSEVFEKVSKSLKSKAFVEILKKRLANVTRDGYTPSKLDDEFIVQNISYDDYVDTIALEIEFAEGALNEE